MSTPTSGGGDSHLFGGDHGSFSYGVGISAGILLIITTITLASYFCTRDSGGTRNYPSHHYHHRDNNHDNDFVIAVTEGIDDATLETYPTYVYSDQVEIMKKGISSMVSCCSICLGDYKGKDVIRMLPECGHVFHVKCVDPWLRTHPTCPLCRTSPLPTPQSTPLAEVAPLAASI